MNIENERVTVLLNGIVIWTRVGKKFVRLQTYAGAIFVTLGHRVHFPGKKENTIKRAVANQRCGGAGDRFIFL